jgi:hypothetical protein
MTLAVIGFRRTTLDQNVVETKAIAYWRAAASVGLGVDQSLHYPKVTPRCTMLRPRTITACAPARAHCVT